MDKEKGLGKIVKKQARSYLKHTVNSGNISSTYTKFDEGGILTVPGLILDKLETDLFNRTLDVANRAYWEYNSETGTLTLKLTHGKLNPVITSLNEKSASNDSKTVIDENLECSSIPEEVNTTSEESENHDNLADKLSIDEKLNIFGARYLKLNHCIPIAPDAVVIPDTMKLYIKSLLVIMKYKTYSSYTSSAPYKFVKKNFQHALKIKNQYEYMLSQRFISAAIAALDLKYTYESSDMNGDEPGAYHRAVEFIDKMIPGFASDTKNTYEALKKLSVKVPDVLFKDHINDVPGAINCIGKYFYEAMTDYLMLSLAEFDNTEMTGTLAAYWLMEADEVPNICGNKVLDHYFEFATDYIEGKYMESDPMKKEYLLTVFLMKYYDLISAKNINEFDVFKRKHDTVRKIVTREFNSHGYNNIGNGFVFSEATIK